MINENTFAEAISCIKSSKHLTVFTGAGVSVESGIPPFRGEAGLWNTYDPSFIDLSYFSSYPETSWVKIKEVFYDFFGRAKPNEAHQVIAEWEAKGIVKAVITQNIDGLHHQAGSREVYEYHGNSRDLVCLNCGARYAVSKEIISKLPPLCASCNSVLKPDFIFFGEGIPEEAAEKSYHEAEVADVFLVVGTTGEVMPACHIPTLAKQMGAKIIEVNPTSSAYTHTITDIHLKGRAAEVFEILSKSV